MMQLRMIKLYGKSNYWRDQVTGYNYPGVIRGGQAYSVGAYDVASGKSRNLNAAHGFSLFSTTPMMASLRIEVPSDGD
jgi:hypothetical protein